MEGGELFCGLKEVADAPRADANVHFHKVGAGDGEELNIGFPCHGPGDQRLAGAGRADEQHALRNFGTQSGVLVWIPQEIHDLPQVLFLLFRASHVCKRDFFAVRDTDAGVGLAEFGDGVAAAHAAQHHYP